LWLRRRILLRLLRILWRVWLRIGWTLSGLVAELGLSRILAQTRTGLHTRLAYPEIIF